MEDYGYLGVQDNDILRREQDERVGRYKQDVLGWNTMFGVAKRFSSGKPCRKGRGTGLDDDNRLPEGSYNVCYWVQVEGIQGEWVVHFPKTGMTTDDLTLIRLRTEAATTQFLRHHTKVPVPIVIGHGEGDDEFPPFVILESLDGIRMSLLFKTDVDSIIFDRVLFDLAMIHLELLSHPFDRIGMLELPHENSPHDVFNLPVPTLGPCSRDAWELARDGVFSDPPAPFTSSQSYYDFKLRLWNRQLEEQRNSVDDSNDGRRKLLNAVILNEFISRLCAPENENDPFYLVHPDLHSSNVILDRNNFHVIGIIDWEGACTLPYGSSCAPPRCLTPGRKDGLVPKFHSYTEFKKHVGRYIKIFSELEQERSTSISTCGIGFEIKFARSCPIASATTFPSNVASAISPLLCPPTPPAT